MAQSPPSSPSGPAPWLRVSPRWLAREAALVWLAVGAMLLFRGARMLVALSQAPPVARGTAAAVGLAIGVLKGRYVLSRASRRNRRRIEALADPRPWNVFAPRMLILIALMIALGLSLRWLAGLGVLSWTFVGALYVGIGAALAASAPGQLQYVPEPPPVPTRIDAAPRPHAPPTGVLVANLGTPDAPTAPAVRRYLREFLTDPKVVDLPRWPWRALLEGVILPRRAPRVAEAYASIWTERGSPLAALTADVAAGLAARLGAEFAVEVCMRYGNPSIAAAVERLVERGCERVVLLPLFPQWSDTTSGTLQEAVARALARHRNAPALTVVPAYYDHPGYVAALAERCREALAGREVDRLLMSFHGLPERYVRLGDPYLCQCAATAWALAERLALPRDRWEMVFQSRFGREPWLQPYLDETLVRLGSEGARVAVVLPGFAADCLETVEEVGIRGREAFEAAGGRELVVVPALNDAPAWIAALEDLVRRTAPPAASRDGSGGWTRTSDTRLMKPVL